MTGGKACVNVASLLPAYAAGALTPAEVRSVTDHLGFCPACRAQLSEWQRIIAAAKVAASGPSPSPDVLDCVLAGIDAPHAQRPRSRPNLWHRMTGGHRQPRPRPLSGANGDHSQARHPGHPVRLGRSAVAEIAVVGMLVMVLGVALLSRDWWGQILGDDSTATPLEATAQLAAQTPTAGGLSFASELSNVSTHPGAQLRLGHLTIEPGSSTGLHADEGSVVLMVQAGIVSGLTEGPAVVSHGAECELAGHTEELATGDHFELQPSDHLFIPAGTSSELHNDGQEAALTWDLRVQSPGPPSGFTNGVQYRQLAQASAQQLPSGELEFSLTEGSLSPGIVHEINGPGIFYVESGTLEITATNADLDIEDDDDLDDDGSIDRSDSDPDEQITGGGWFFLKAGEHASLIGPVGQATYLELLFDPRDTVEQNP